MTLPLIGLTGYKRHGKDRTAQELVRHGYDPVAFADPLRDLVSAIDPVVALHPDATPRDFSTDEMIRYREVVTDLGYEAAKDDYPEVRAALVAVGQSGIRECLGERWGLNELLGASLWVALAEVRIREALRHRRYDYETNTIKPVWERRLAFTDVRMVDEADMIRSHGGVIVRVVRDGAPTPDVDEVTEHALDDYLVDYTIRNDGTPEGLAAEVDALIRRLQA